MRKGDPDPPREVLSSFRSLASLALRRNKAEKERIHLQRSLELLNQRFIEIEEKERAKVSMDLHYQLGQSLTAIIMEVKWIQKKASGNAEVMSKLEDMLVQLSDVTRSIQVISSSLRPAMLTEIGLCATMEWYCNEFQSRTGISCKQDFETVTTGDHRRELAIYRILQEALSNVEQHSAATETRVSLKREEQGTVLTIRDNGKGIDPEEIDSLHSLGLIGMRERVKPFGGELKISSKPDKGTLVRVTIP
jgi:two-component system sensor histidine kinase UhpB